MIGQRFGRLEVIDDAGCKYNGKQYWTCKCDCGTEKDVREYHLTGGKIVSCGCHRATLNKTHGLAGSPEHWAWNNMNQRCHNANRPDFYRYGGRGITVCQRWKTSFEMFLQDVGLRPSPKHTLERIDNEKGYEPGNVEWRTMHHQSRNKRNNVFYEIDGVSKTLVDWVAIYGIASGTVRKRLKKGWDIKRALTTPPDEAFSRNMTKDRVEQAYVEFQGEKLPLSELAKRHGINLSTLRKRLRNGMDLRTALTMPINTTHSHS